MDGLSAVASIIAVLQVAIAVAKLCSQYAQEVNNASKDVERIREQADTTLGLLLHTQKLFDGPYKHKLSTSRDLWLAISGCREELEILLTKLEVNFSKPPAGKDRRRDKILRPFKRNAYDSKWQLTKKETEETINRLVKAQESIDRALQIDQIKIVLSVEQRANLARLPIAEGAVFNSFEDEGEPECLSGTRTDLLRDLHNWVADPKETRIFWLCGMAGTGKSTISRTFARILSEKGQLGASFFFKRGKANRGDASRFISSLAIDLQTALPILGPSISDAVENDPNIGQKALPEQFRRLLFDPLEKLRLVDITDPEKAIVLVIDALDECEGSGIVKRIIDLLGQLAGLDLNIRIFVTSRPEAPIKSGFGDLKRDHKDISLHIIQTSTIKNDILIFIRHELDNIRKNRSLGGNWPGDSAITTLTDMAVPLFISAATLCRFIGDHKFSAHQRLENVLKFQNAAFVSKLDQTYHPIFNQILADTDSKEREELIREFRDIIGVIVLLESPLGLISLSLLLNKSEDQTRCLLDHFHSVINVPNDPEAPIQIYHLSFREYLLDDSNNGNWYWLDAGPLHWSIGGNCLQMLSKMLQPDMCKLVYPATEVSSINPSIRSQYIRPEVAYACQYWCHHIMCSTRGLNLDDEKSKLVLAFLQNHLLHWFEVMSILGAFEMALSALDSLKSSNGDLLALIVDATLFVNLHSATISQTPLQIYSSALLFTPNNSLVKKLFSKALPAWVGRVSNWHEDWSLCIQKVPDDPSIPSGRREFYSIIAISPDGRYLASNPQELRDQDPSSKFLVWNAVSRKVLQSIEISEIPCLSKWGKRPLLHLNFSPDNKYLLVVLDGDITFLWDLAAEKSIILVKIFTKDSLTLQPRFDFDVKSQYERPKSFTCSTFSSDCRLLAVATPGASISFWQRLDVESDFQSLYLECPRERLKHIGDFYWNVPSIKFISNNAYVIAAIHGIDTREWKVTKVINVTWDTSTRLIVKFDLDESVPIFSTFSPDLRAMAVALPDSSVELRDIASAMTLQIFKPPPSCERRFRQARGNRILEFSSDGRLLGIGYEDGTITILDLQESAYIEGGAIEIPGGQSLGVHAMAFSRKGDLLFFTRGFEINIWTVDFSNSMQSSNHKNKPEPGQRSFTMRKSYQIQSQRYGSPATLMRTILKSPDDRHLAVILGSRELIIWDSVSDQQDALLLKEYGRASEIVFSSDSRWLVALTRDMFGTFLTRWKLHDDNIIPTKSNFRSQTTSPELETQEDPPRSISVSADGNQVFYLVGEGTVENWDWSTGTRTQLYTNRERREPRIDAARLTPDGQHLVLVTSSKASVEVLDISAGSITRELNQFSSERDRQPSRRCREVEASNIAFSADGMRLAIARNYEVFVYDMESGKIVNILSEELTSPPRCISFLGTDYILKIDEGHYVWDLACQPPTQVPKRLDFCDEWIHVYGTPVLRLPTEPFGRYSLITVAGSILVFMLKTNKLASIEIRDQTLNLVPD